MKRIIVLVIALTAAAVQAALPSLSDIATGLAEFRERLGGLTNWQGSAESRIEAMRDRVEELRETLDALVMLVEGDKNLRERFHRGRLGQYILTNDVGRIIRVDLYADGSCWTNGNTEAVYLPPDPEERKRAIAAEAARIAAERERVQAAWEAAHLPPDLAALRARQRAAKREEVAE